jgi:hypothetical protein
MEGCGFADRSRRLNTLLEGTWYNMPELDEQTLERRSLARNEVSEWMNAAPHRP